MRYVLLVALALLGPKADAVVNVGGVSSKQVEGIVSVSVSSVDTTKVNKTGDAMTGQLRITDAAGAATGYDEANQAPSGNFVSNSSGAVVRINGVIGYSLIGSGGIHGFGFNGLGGYLTGVCHNGTEAVPTPCASGDLITFIGAKPYDGSTQHTSFSSKAAIQMTASETSAVGANGTNISLDTTLNGTSTRRQRFKLYNDGRVAVAPRANSITPLGLLHLSGTDSGISVTGNGVSLYATEAVVSLSSFTGTAVYSSGIISAGGGGQTMYYCSGSTNGTFDGNTARGNSNAAACLGGTWVATSYRMQ